MCPRFAIRKGVKVLSRLDIMTPSRAQTVIDGLYRDVERRIAASPPGLCPVDLALNFLNLCHAQTCGKCVPCRVGLGQLSDLMESVLDGKATMETIALIERTARVIVNSADCAIGRDAARLVLDGIQGFRDDYEEHVLRHRCLGGMQNPVPCVALCPAGVDIPGYTVLVKYGRYADAVRLIRQDNPFPSACAYICEHPCEARCRRNMIDDAVNIRGLKRYAVVPYDQYLRYLPAYLQQLDMESNGKFIDKDGEVVNYSTGPVLFGGAGTDVQHSFFQLIHQGTDIVPVDFIIPAISHNEIGDHHEILVANVLAQGEALMRGKTVKEAARELTKAGKSKQEVKELKLFKSFSGNRPSNTLVLKKADPYTLGMLVAMYEHKVFVQGVIWNINSYDQMGVELGKQMALNILPELQGNASGIRHDSSTANLISTIKRLRK